MTAGDFLRLGAYVLCWGLAAMACVVTVLPLSDSNVWWIRILDFPRLQIAVAAAAVLVFALILPGGTTRLVVTLLMLAVCGYQLWRILPYTPLAGVEMTLADPGPDSVRILSSNVLMENDDYDSVMAVVRAFDPDILLLMETDQVWVDAVEPVLAGYATVIREPKDNHYGMVFATRLPVVQARTIQLTASETPSLFAELTAPDGTTFRFVGLHPRPPVPGENTKERDAQIYYAARFARDSPMPVVVTGDFNDVAWSDTSRTFKRVGEYLDPRIGRGFFASFDADRAWLRFPIDQMYVTPNVAVVSIERRAYVGSDHFPMAATLRFDATLASRLNVTPKGLSDAERSRIERSNEETRLRLGHTKP